MANLLRLAKSGNDWGVGELAAYNIEVQFQDAPTFFGVDPLPAPTVADEVLTRINADDMEADSNYKLIRYMDLAMDPVPTEESAVDDFAVHLLTVLGYVPRTRMTRTRADIPLQICGELRHAKTDVCIVDSDDILLLIQEGKRHKEPKDPEPQLIAEAIAAFQANNSRRTRILGQDAIEAKVVPGITLVGSSPTFFKVPVTSELAQAVALGQYPATRTVVQAHLPTIPRPPRRLSEGMRPLDNRRQILSCYEAFKRFVNWHNGSLAAHVPRPHSVAYACSKHAVLGLTKASAIEGRHFDIAVTQKVDIGNAHTSMVACHTLSALQPDGRRVLEPMFDPVHVAQAIVHIASLPNSVTVLNINIMATGVPHAGRG